eukprot:5056753-Pleurochrysis_carterae.AAC.1
MSLPRRARIAPLHCTYIHTDRYGCDAAPSASQKRPHRRQLSSGAALRQPLHAPQRQPVQCEA